MGAVAESMVERLAGAMRSLPESRHIDPEPIHLFAPGMYVRVLHMPAGSVIVSKIHRTEHFALAMTGRATVVNGEHREEIVGPRIMRTMPGTQRALYIHEDAVWLTLHPLETADTQADESDLAEIEERLIAPSHDDPVLIERLKQIEKGG